MVTKADAPMLLERIRRVVSLLREATGDLALWREIETVAEANASRASALVDVLAYLEQEVDALPPDVAGQIQQSLHAAFGSAELVSVLGSSERVAEIVRRGGPADESEHSILRAWYDHGRGELSDDGLVETVEAALWKWEAVDRRAE